MILLKVLTLVVGTAERTRTAFDLGWRYARDIADVPGPPCRPFPTSLAGVNEYFPFFLVHLALPLLEVNLESLTWCVHATATRRCNVLGSPRHQLPLIRKAVERQLVPLGPKCGSWTMAAAPKARAG
jgi:hypothetical protein